MASPTPGPLGPPSFVLPSARGPLLALALIFVLAFSVSVVGLDWGLPYVWNADEKVSLAADMIARDSANPKYFVNPSLHAYLVTALVELAYATEPGQRVEESIDVLARMTVPGQPGRRLHFLWYRLARLLSVLGAMLTIWLIFVLGRHQFGEPTGLVAAALLAVTMGLANLAHFATPEATLFVFVVATLVAADVVAARGNTRDYILAGVALGLACSTKYTVGLLVASSLAHVPGAGFAAIRRDCGTRRSPRFGRAGVLATTPYALFNHQLRRRSPTTG